MTSATTQSARGARGRHVEGHGLILFASVMPVIMGEGRTAGPTPVIVLVHRVFGLARLAHAPCADSHIIGAGAAAMRAAARRTAALRHGQQARRADRQLGRGESHLARKCLA